MPISDIVPVLRVVDVTRSIQWYRDLLGFSDDPFPDVPPYRFAIMRHGLAEFMLRLGQPHVKPTSAPYDWDIYIRCENTRFRELFDICNSKGIVTRRLERMPYGMSEFEVVDPDGYGICLAQELEDDSDLPSPEL